MINNQVFILEIDEHYETKAFGVYSSWENVVAKVRQVAAENNAEIIAKIKQESFWLRSKSGEFKIHVKEMEMDR